MEIQESEFEKLEKIHEKYNELIFAVENKHPKESRHQAALRFIREAQSSHNEADPRDGESDGVDLEALDCLQRKSGLKE